MDFVFVLVLIVLAVITVGIITRSFYKVSANEKKVIYAALEEAYREIIVANKNRSQSEEVFFEELVTLASTKYLEKGGQKRIVKHFVELPSNDRSNAYRSIFTQKIIDRIQKGYAQKEECILLNQSLDQKFQAIGSLKTVAEIKEAYESILSTQEEINDCLFRSCILLRFDELSDDHLSQCDHFHSQKFDQKINFYEIQKLESDWAEICKIEEVFTKRHLKAHLQAIGYTRWELAGDTTLPLAVKQELVKKVTQQKYQVVSTQSLALGQLAIRAK